MQNACRNMVPIGSVRQELAFIEAALRQWQSLNIAGRSPARQKKAADTVLHIYSSFLIDAPAREIRLAEETDVDALRAILAALVAVGWSTAESGLAQAWVHAGLEHRDRIPFFWHPRRFAMLSDFSRATIRKLDARIATLDARKAAPTLH